MVLLPSQSGIRLYCSESHGSHWVLCWQLLQLFRSFGIAALNAIENTHAVVVQR